jgi:hypothetical protein
MVLMIETLWNFTVGLVGGKSFDIELIDGR